ncbi:hypothetical protein E2986_07960 [Frieseomelitta varia]|uniref:ATP-dependent DNA helicase 2 subunit 1 n=1 Tax=Frieseomelitta varia TaxID=561572 RepID=A0A833RTU3_9HYME|nr:X-ray repair cross-complementing protein 6-like [Frieseomelitta varia]XP_043520423.1 X-ray repair cross-complementing protein 6-like [Frieseomelitta varia]KAF3423285.1 hypothetical protein E2986_07960 [Frieseomelitta varia]
MAFFDNEDIENEPLEDDPKELYGVREGTIFVIDATLPMFKNDPDNPHFLQCVKQYKEVLKQKLIWDRQDWIGLMLFGTEESDKDLRHILTLHDLGVSTVENLKEVMKIDEGKKWEHYRDTASSTAYPLHDVLQHAERTFFAIRTTMSVRRVILFTCQDNPPLTDDNEKHKIRRQVKSFSDIGLQLIVIGLGENWNHDSFYKDLEMSSRKIDVDDYKRMSLKDVVEQVKVPSKNMAKLPWRLGENVIVDVVLRSLSSKTSYLPKVYMSKEDNIPLTCNTYYVSRKNSDTEDVEDEESQRETLVLETNIQKYQTFGGEKICFTSAEVKSMCVTREPGIDLICIQPCSHHPLYHVETPYFVMPNKKSYREDNKLLFAALLNKCDEKKLMIICVVTLRRNSTSSLYTMMPNAKNGGFYLYKIPFKENMRNISKYFPDYIYDDVRKPPTDPEGVEVLEQLIEKLSFEYNPKLFSNPKLQVQLQTVETLALDLEQLEPPLDNTRPAIDKMRKLADDLLEKYDEIFSKDDINDTPPKKKSKTSNESTGMSDLNTDKIQKIVKSGQIVYFTAAQLKDILKTLGLKTSGKKDELINRIRSHF